MIIIYYRLLCIIHIKISKYIKIYKNFVKNHQKGDNPFLSSDLLNFGLILKIMIDFMEEILNLNEIDDYLKLKDQ